MTGKVTRKRDLVMEFCAGLCSTAKSCVLQDQHRKFAGCDLDSDILKTADSDHLSPFASQMLSPNSDCKENEEVTAAA